MAELQLLLGPRDPDEEEPPLLLQLASSRRPAQCGRIPCSRPTMKTTGNSSPLAACRVIRVTAPGVVLPAVDGRGQADLLQEVDDRSRRGARGRTRGRPRPVRRRSPAGPRPPAFGVGLEVLAVAGEVEELADHLLGGVVAEGVARPSAGRSRAEPARPCPSGPGRPPPGGPSPAAAGPASRRARPGARATSCRCPRGRHVDHPAERDVVLRVGHQVQVGQDVLDLLPLVERHARRRPGTGLAPPRRAGSRPRVRALTRQKTAKSPVGVLPLADQLDDPRGDALGLVGSVG